MLRSRRLAFVAAAVVLGLSACGDAANTTSSGKAPAVIRIGAAQGAPNAAPSAAGGAAETADMKMMMPWGEITYVYDGAFADLGATGPAWLLPANPTVDTAKVQALAAAFGIEGEVRTLPAEQGGGWQVGSADYTGASITVGTDGMVSWWFNPDPSVFPAPVACEGAVGGVAVDPAVDPNGAAVTPETVPAEVTVPDCPAPLPPANVPSKDEAIAKAKDLFGSLGYDMSQYELDAYADEWGANVTAFRMLNGVRSPLSLSVGFGGEGVVTWASGSLAEPQAAGDYPLVDGATALARLNDRSGKWGWFGGGWSGGPAVRAATADAAATATPESAPAPEPAPPVDTVLVDPMPVDTFPVDTMPAPEPITITLNSMKLDITMVWGEDGTVYLLPAYTFGTTDGGAYTIVAVDESLLDLPDPVAVDPAVTEPAPVETTPAVAPEVTTDQAAVLVGLTLDEATAAAEANGWLVRVSTLDGQAQPLTMDYLTNRVNVSVQDGSVVAIDNIG